MSLLYAVIAIAQPMIEKIALPSNADFMGGVMLPERDRMPHTRLGCETHQSMMMARHEQQQMHPPIAALFAAYKRIMKPSGRGRLTELILTTWLGADGDEI
jgi:hypothetical protein